MSTNTPKNMNDWTVYVLDSSNSGLFWTFQCFFHVYLITLIIIYLQWQADTFTGLVGSFSPEAAPLNTHISSTDISTSSTTHSRPSWCRFICCWCSCSLSSFRFAEYVWGREYSCLHSRKKPSRADRISFAKRIIVSDPHIWCKQSQYRTYKCAQTYYEFYCFTTW